MVSEAAHELALRGDCTETGGMWDAAADAITAKVAGASGLGTVTPFRPNGTLYTVGTAGHAATTKTETVRTAVDSSWTAAAETASGQTSQPTDSQTVQVGVSVPIS